MNKRICTAILFGSLLAGSLCLGCLSSFFGPSYNDVLPRLFFTNDKLPQGCVLKKGPGKPPFSIQVNPTLTTDRSLATMFSEVLFKDSVEPDHIVEVFYSIYEEDAELGVFGTRLC